jgi:hypothetical protein
MDRIQVFDIDVGEGKNPHQLVGQYLTLDFGKRKLHFYCTEVVDTGYLKARVTAQLVKRPS